MKLDDIRYGMSLFLYEDFHIKTYTVDKVIIGNTISKTDSRRHYFYVYVSNVNNDYEDDPEETCITMLNDKDDITTLYDYTTERTYYFDRQELVSNVKETISQHITCLENELCMLRNELYDLENEQ